MGGLCSGVPLSRGVSVQGVSALGSLSGRPPYDNEQVVRIPLECILVLIVCNATSSSDNLKTISDCDSGESRFKQVAFQSSKPSACREHGLHKF